MSAPTLEDLAERLHLADELLAGRKHMLEPQDLPGRYGRVIKAIDHLLDVLHCEAVIGGGWAVWRHGYIGRVTQDVDILLGADRVADFIRAASVAGFEPLPQQPGRWPKLVHKETGVVVDLLPEGERPGTPSKPAPTVLPHPSSIGGRGSRLRYITLAALIQLKLGAARARDESDVIELIRANPDQVETIADYLAQVHPGYAAAFKALIQRAAEQEDH